MEQLVGSARRPNHVVVDLPPSHRPEDRLAGTAVTPAAPLDQQSTLRVRMESPHLAEKLASSRPVEPLRSQDQCDVLPRGRQRLELRHRLFRRGHADDSIAPCVPVEQLALDVEECSRIVVDYEQDRTGRIHSASGVSRRVAVVRLVRRLAFGLRCDQ